MIKVTQPHVGKVEETILHPYPYSNRAKRRSIISKKRSGYQSRGFFISKDSGDGNMTKVAEAKDATHYFHPTKGLRNA